MVLLDVPHQLFIILLYSSSVRKGLILMKLGVLTLIQLLKLVSSCFLVAVLFVFMGFALF